MIKRICQYLRQQYFAPHLSFEYRLFMIFFIEALMLSVLSAITNTLLQKGFWGQLFQWSFIAFMIVLSLLPARIRMKTAKPLLVFVSFVYVPFLFFQTAGYDGTAGLFALIAIFLMTVLFRGKTRIVMVISNIILWMLICTAEYLHPELVIGHGGDAAKFVDYIVAITLTMSGIAILGVYYRTQFDLESTRITHLNNELESSNRVLERMAVCDPLTNVYNRRYVTERLTSDIMGLKEDETLFFMMLDLDHFKNVNDTFGHQVGDEVLVQFAELLKSVVRDKDIVARLGGEEFFVAVYDATLSQANSIAERICLNVSQTIFSQGVHLTVSIGLVPVRQGDRYDIVFSRADYCMYQAKLQGRNRVVVETPDSDQNRPLC